MRRFLALSLLLISGPALAYEMEDVRQIQFELRDPKSGEVYYSGKEEISVDGKTIKRDARTFDAQKKEVQSEVISFDKDSLRTSEYEYKNNITGEESRVKAADAEFGISYREAADKKPKEGTLKNERKSFLGKVVSYLILRNWKALNSNKIIKFNLVLPSRLESIPFQIVHRKSYQKDGEQREVFALIPQNVLIRSLAPHLEFEFSGGEKPMPRQFLAPSSLPVKGAKDKMVYYTFTYPTSAAEKK